MKNQKPSSTAVRSVLRSACLDLAGSLILSAILLSFTSCGTKREPAMVDRPSEKMPNREVPAPGEEGSLVNDRRGDLEKAEVDSTALKQSGCQSAVVPGSAAAHLCCTKGVKPPHSQTCEQQWRKVGEDHSCVLSFTIRTGVLWGCGEKTASSIGDAAPSVREI